MNVSFERKNPNRAEHESLYEMVTTAWSVKCSTAMIMLLCVHSYRNSKSLIKKKQSVDQKW